MNELKHLCSFIEQLKYEDIPAEVIDYTELLIADHYISSVAGYVYNKKFNEPLIKLLNEDGAEGRCTVQFQDKRLHASLASFINAVYCHGADIDDGHREAEAHPGVAVIASVLALAEETGSSGKDTLTAVIAGYEAFIRFAKAILPSHLTRGFHTTGTVGALAAAVGCAKLLNLNADGIEKAISLAATQASGLLIVCESGQAAKPINPGRAAQTGIYAARLAAVDVDAPVDVFDSKKGFSHAFSDTYRPTALEEDLGIRYYVLDTYVKLYPSCRHTHATIEAIKKFFRENGDIENPKEIEIHTYPIAVDIVGHNTNPQTIGDVKFSIPYTASCMILHKNYTLENLAKFDEQKEKIIDFSRKIRIISEEKYDDLKNGIRGSEVVVIDQAGYKTSSSVRIARGEGTDRIDWPTLEEKALSITPTWSEQSNTALFNFCKAIHSMPVFKQAVLKLGV